MADISEFRQNYFHNYKNIGYTLYLSYLHPKDIESSLSDFSLAGNVFACSRDKIDPALLAPEVQGFGEYELIMDDLEYSTYPTVDNYKGASFASAITFTIREPYGMSLLEILSAMHRNDSKSRPNGPSDMNYMLAPYCLTIEYSGYDTDDKGGRMYPFTQFRRQIPVILREVSFNLTASGAVYNVKAIPLAETPQIENTKIEQTISFKGNTVGDMLSAFQAVLNLKEVERWQNFYKDDAEKMPGPFVLHNFLYQDMSSDLLNSKLVVDEVNEKGKTQLALSSRLPMGNAKQTAQDRTKRPIITNNTEVDYTVTANQKTIQQVIIDIITSSAWFYDQYRAKERNGNIGKEQPLIKIPKIFTYVQITSPRDPKTNTFNRAIQYAIVLHDYLNTNTTNYGLYSQEQLDIMKKHKELKTVREYNYLFTGKNIDILDLDMKFNMLFYNSLSDNNNRYGPGSQINSQHRNTTFKQDDTTKSTARAKPSQTSDDVAKYGGLPGNNVKLPPVPRTGIDLDRANFYAQVRNDFERIFDTGSLTDFQTLNMTIVGDPAYINDGLYRWDKFTEMIKDRQGAVAILNDGTIDWTQDVFIKLNVNRPVQGIDGSMQYAVSTLMSRTYRIQRIKHSFRNGKFTQAVTAVFTPPIPLEAATEEEFVETDTGLYVLGSETGAQNPPDAELTELSQGTASASTDYAKQQALTQQLGAAYARAYNDPNVSQLAKDQIKQAYEDAGAKLNSMPRITKAGGGD